MTVPYGCRLELCDLYGVCDPRAPVAGCPLVREVLQDRSGCVSEHRESAVVAEIDEQHAAALEADSRVIGGALRHVQSNDVTEIGIVQKVVGDLQHARAR